MNQVTRAFTAQVDDVNASERSIVAKISTGAIDRYNTVFDVKGFSLESYNQNRVVLFEHGRDPLRGSMPIGKNLWIKAAGIGANSKLIAKTQFKKDDFSQQLYEAYRDGDMRGWSISAIPSDYGPPTKEEIRNRPELANVSNIYRSVDLCEYSAVSVPGNPDCLTSDELRSASRVIARGIPVPEDVKPLVEAAVAAMAAELADSSVVELMGEETAEAAQEAATADDSPADRNGPGCMEGKAKEESKPAPFAKSDEEDEEEKEAEDNEEEEKEEKKPKRDMMDGDPVDENCGGKKRSAPEPPSEPAPVAPAIIINPTPERAAPAPVLTLPPLEGRSYNVVLMDLIAQARAARVSLTEEFQAYHDWLHGKV